MLGMSGCCKTVIEYYPEQDGSEKRQKYVYEENAITKEKCGSYVWLTYEGDTIENSSFSNGKENGVCKVYFDHNKVQVKAECSDGMQHGVLKEWYKNGQLRIECVYDRNRLWNVKALFDSSGNALPIGSIRDGNGFLKNYYPDGKVQYQGNFQKRR
jgi:antitoxin component YwqK of YwqJK toxin-antitoxin module